MPYLERDRLDGTTRRILVIQPSRRGQYKHTLSTVLHSWDADQGWESISRNESGVVAVAAVEAVGVEARCVDAHVLTLVCSRLMLCGRGSHSHVFRTAGQTGRVVMTVYLGSSCRHVHTHSPVRGVDAAWGGGGVGEHVPHRRLLLVMVLRLVTTEGGRRHLARVSVVPRLERRGCFHAANPHATDSVRDRC